MVRARGLRRYALDHQLPLKLVADGVAWVLGLVLAIAVRYDFSWAQHGESQRWLVMALLAVTVQWSAGLLLGLYRGRYRFGSFDEVAGVLGVVVLTAVVLATANVLAGIPHLVPVSTIPAAAVVAVTLMTGVRYSYGRRSRFGADLGAPHCRRRRRPG